MRASASVLAAVLVLLVTLGHAQVPRTLSYQGVLTDTLGHPKPDGSYNFTFRLYATNSGGTAIWSETKTLSLSRGLFSTSLGDQVPIGLRFDVPYWIGVQVTADPELSPRVQLTSGGYSFRSLNADTAQYAKSAPQQAYVDSARITGTIPDNAVTSTKLADGSVTQAKLAGGVTLPPGGSAGGDLSGTFPNPTISGSAVNTAKLADNAVTSSKLADGSVTQVKLAGGVTLPPGGSAGGDLSGTFPNPTINGSAVNSAKLADNAVTSSKLADGSVTTSKIADNGISAQKIQSAQVVKSINTLRDNVVLSAGTNVSITPSGNTLTIASASGGTITGVNAGTGLTGGGTSGDVTLSVAAPLKLTGSYPNDYLISSYNQSGPAMYAQTAGSSDGIFVESGSGRAVAATSGTGAGVSGQSGNIGVYAHNTSGTPGRDAYLATKGLAADLFGDVFVHGSVTKSGGSFKIDHPLDPANKSLYHSFVESPDMKNIYDGVVVLDARGEATVQMPEWFEALNKDFRYQLTAVGAPGPNLYVAEEIQSNRFRIAGGANGMKVSWQVTGTRQDAWANAHRIPVEEDKTAAQTGYYEHPELFGQPESRNMQQAIHPETATMITNNLKMQESMQQESKRMDLKK